MKTKRGSAVIRCAVVGLLLGHLATPAFGQGRIDEPQLSPMLFGESEKERRDKIEQRKQDEEEAHRISLEQEEDRQTLDEPRLDPLVFGPNRDEEEDLTGSRITLGEEDQNRGFFSAFTYLIPEETNLSIGVGPVYRPDYFGSDDYEFGVDPKGLCSLQQIPFP